MLKQRSTNVDLYNFKVDHAHLSRDAVQSLTICLLRVLKHAIPEMLESAIENEILHEG